jgi:hemerythrin-like domain-containing protein
MNPQLAELNHIIADITARIKSTRAALANAEPNSIEHGQLAKQLADLTRQRGRAYSKRYIIDEDKRAKANEKAKAYYAANKDLILTKNKEAYKAAKKQQPDQLAQVEEQPEEAGAYPSPPAADLVYDDMIQPLKKNVRRQRH